MTSHDNALRTVGEVAELLGLSVRTLHHWEERGVATPSGRSWSNYRLYSADDVARLQQVMVYRAAGMSLDAISGLLSDDGDPVHHLQHQRDLLMKKTNELHRMVQAIDELLEDAMSKNELSVEEVAQILGDADFPVYQAEAEEKWGDSDDWKASQQATSAMSKDDWQAVQDKTTEVEEALAAAMRRGVEPGTEEANSLAEQHRELISTFFPVSHSKHVLMACNYVDDPRFGAYYDKRGEGLAQWLKAVIDANATSHGVDPANARWE